MHSASSGWLRDRAGWITTVLFISLAAFLLLPLQPAARAAAGKELRVYVSLPKKGANADTSRLISKGLKAAVRAQGNRVQGKRLRLVELNDARGARWHPPASSIYRSYDLTQAQLARARFHGDLIA